MKVNACICIFTVRSPMGVSSDYKNLFLKTDISEVETVFGKLTNENKQEFLKAAGEIFNEISSQYEHTISPDEKLKNMYNDLKSKFNKVLEQFKNIPTIETVMKRTIVKTLEVGTEKPDTSKQKKIEFNTLIENINEQMTNKTLTTDKIQEHVEAVLTWVKSNPEVFADDPSLATKGHQLLHDLAQQKIAEGHLLNNKKIIEATFQSAFMIELKAVEAFPLAPTHPLHNMGEAILEGSAKQYDSKMGANFGSMDSSVVKGGHLHATQRKIDGVLINSFDFKISHYARDELTKYMNAIIYHPTVFISSLPPDLASRVHINANYNVRQTYKRYDESNNQFTSFGEYGLPAGAKEIVFDGIGKIIIGHPDCMYNWIQVEMNVPAVSIPGEEVRRLQQILAVTGLGPVLGKQPPESDERMKIAQLFRAFYPAQCTEMDTKKEFYQWPLEKLKQEIIKRELGMEAIFKKYLVDQPELVKKVEIQPGKEVWGILDLGQLMKKKGAWGLMTGIGNSGGWDSAKAAVVRALTQGAMSTEQRFQTGVFKTGCSPDSDLRGGGGDQVFTRLLNTKVNTNNGTRSFPFSGAAQILWNLDTVAQRVPYCFPSDCFGIRSKFDDIDYSFYKNRKSLEEFSEQARSTLNEVMVKNVIDPSHVKGILVFDQQKKDDLIEHLKKNNLAKERPDGKILITYANREVLADEFIHVSTFFKQEFWG